MKEENMYGKGTLGENKMSRRLFGNQRTDTRAVPPVYRLTSTNFEDEIFLRKGDCYDPDLIYLFN
jgi:hypothetical protein